MQQRISLITVITDNLPAAKACYAQLGWLTYLEAEGEVAMYQVGEHLIFSLWDHTHAEQEIGPVTLNQGQPPVTLAHNVGSRVEVDEVLSELERAGADITAAGTEREWGGYTGYAVTPDGVLWEIAHAPGELGALVVP